MVPLVQMGLALARKEAARVAANMAKRAARIEASGTTTAALARFRELQALKPPQTRNEAVSRLAELRKLDQSKGTRFSSAQRQSQLEHARAQREATAETLIRNPRSLPDPKLVDDLYTNLKKSVKGRVDRVKADPRIQSTPATDAFDQWLEDQPANPTRRQRAAQTRRLLDISKYQGINKKGALLQHNRGLEAFGPDYDTWTKDQQKAAWEGFRKLADRNNTSMSSDQTLAEVRAASKDGSLKVAFYSKTESDGRGGKRQVTAAAVSTHLDTAKREAAMAEYTAKRLEHLLGITKGRARLI